MRLRRAISGVLTVLLAAGAPPVFAQEASPAATPGGGPYAATDAVGRTVTLEEPADRVVCLQVGCDEVMADLGLLPVASATSSALPRFGYPIFYGARAADVATIEDGGSVEAVAAFEPDLIYVAEVDDARDAMAAVAPVFVGHQFNDVAGYAGNLRGMGALTGRSGQAAEAMARFRGVVAVVASRAPEAAPNLRVLVLFGDPEVYRVALDGAQFCRILRENGLGRCAIEAPPLRFDDVTLPFADVDAEAILAADPDLVGIIGVEDASGAARADPVWSRLGAVASGRVYGDPSLGMYCCGLRQISIRPRALRLPGLSGSRLPRPRPVRGVRPGPAGERAGSLTRRQRKSDPSGKVSNVPRPRRKAPIGKSQGEDPAC